MAPGVGQIACGAALPVRGLPTRRLPVMPLAIFRNLVLDAVDPAATADFWAGALDLDVAPSESGSVLVHRQGVGVLRVVPADAAKTLKHRLHMDIYAEALADLEAIGARVVVPQHGSLRWSVLADPDDGEFCAFLRQEPPEHRLHGLVLDCSDVHAQSRWWAGVLGGTPVDDGYAWDTLPGVLGDIATMDFCPVPEPKGGCNRLRPELVAADIEAVIAAGAVRIQGPSADGTQLLADPEGNEFDIVLDG